MYDNFCRHNMSGTTRSRVSVTHRWQSISVACTKWAACIASVERLNPSGANANDKVTIAQRLYKGRPNKRGGKKGKPGKGFALHHCWVLLEHDEKWRTRNLEVPSKSKKSNNSCSPTDDECVDIGSEDEDSIGRRSPTPSSAVEMRPLGRKQVR
ncbi:hypothetical protein EJB05_15051 [Eragrostis curvula]|uniref:No apical meristem-associated C-terminal domain-containing protein n=1 Tax=Eragrostis curvula TaxID=38414 RepID=A0A5J9W0S9_9POAL|nr:hypothetical protein EJB05_15051 [Eragrostis curvula]